ncbi:MAG: hypothetical protein U5L06_03170, partial [Rhodovibrio sp.]|nr:hypothetical protein [Rhodovibrio sp.]
YADGQVATRAREIAAGQSLDITFADDSVSAVAGGGDGAGASRAPDKPAPSRSQPTKKTARSRGKPADEGGQGSLL